MADYAQKEDAIPVTECGAVLPPPPEVENLVPWSSGERKDVSEFGHFEKLTIPDSPSLVEFALSFCLLQVM